MIDEMQEELEGKAKELEEKGRELEESKSENTELRKQIEELNITEPKNLEEQALSLAGTDVYEKLIKGYTEKQWGRPCTELPSFIIRLHLLRTCSISLIICQSVGPRT